MNKLGDLQQCFLGGAEKQFLREGKGDKTNKGMVLGRAR